MRQLVQVSSINVCDWLCPEVQHFFMNANNYCRCVTLCLSKYGLVLLQLHSKLNDFMSSKLSFFILSIRKSQLNLEWMKPHSSFLALFSCLLCIALVCFSLVCSLWWEGLGVLWKCIYYTNVYFKALLYSPLFGLKPPSQLPVK